MLTAPFRYKLYLKEVMGLAHARFLSIQNIGKFPQKNAKRRGMLMNKNRKKGGAC